MSNSQDRFSFFLLLTCGGIAFLLLGLLLSSSAQADTIYAVRVNAINAAGNSNFYTNYNFSNTSGQWVTQANGTPYSLIDPDGTSALPIMLCDLGSIQTISAINLSKYGSAGNNIKEMTLEFYDSPALSGTPVYSQTFTNISQSGATLTLTSPTNARFVKFTMTKNYNDNRYGVGNITFNVSSTITPSSGTVNVGTYSDMSVANLFDKSCDSRWCSANGADSGKNYFDYFDDPVFTFQLDAAKTLTGITVQGYNVTGNSIKDFELEFLDSAGNKISVEDASKYKFTMTDSTNGVQNYFSFPTVEGVKSVKMTVTSNFTKSIGNGGDRIGLSEVYFNTIETDAATTPVKYDEPMHADNIVRPTSASYVYPGSARAADSGYPLTNLFDGTGTSSGNGVWCTMMCGSDYFDKGYSPIIDFTMPSESMYDSFSIWGYFEDYRRSQMTDFILELFDSSGNLVFAEEYKITQLLSNNNYVTFSLGANYLFSKARLTALDNGYYWFNSSGGDRVGFAEIAFYQEPYYFVNTADIDLASWTINGTDKQGVLFTQGDQTAEFANPVILNADGTFEIGEEKNLTLSGVVSGSGKLEKIGAGTLTLSRANTYTGETKVSAGTLNLTKVGKKGTLATGSVLTVDGATSVVTGHGDIFGYGDETLGTINLTNGGTLHNDASNAHITVGAVINMNNGVISSESGNGSATFGNYVFDNAINVLGGTDNAISANRITLRYYTSTPGEAGGKFTVADGAKLTISSRIDDPDGYFVPLVKQGAGTLVLSGDCYYTTGTFVNGGTLQLTKTGQKGTLATGSTVTVDGATSVLAGHGDILGYSSSSVGTVNLQNGGMFYNDSTNAHVTVGAAINMNNGVISSENGNGSGEFGNFVFDNAINVTGGTDNAITANRITLRQYDGTSAEEVGGKITVAEGAKLTISSQIMAHNSAKVVPLVKLGAGELVLSGDSTFTTGTFVNEGTLRLTKVGKKGTLAVGSAITVDGATSVLTGHGDIFGYADETVGTINLTNGGKLHNDATNAHVTIGAAVNMNNGVISAENGSGDNRFGNYVFDNAINVQGGTDNEINANKISLRMYPNTPGNAGGQITVAQDAQLKISSQIIDPDSNLVPLVKQGAGTLTLSGDNTYTKGANVNEGTLQLTGDAVKANSSITIADNATLEYNVASGEKSLDFTTSNTTVSGSGNVLKSGTGKLKIKADRTQFSADKFAVSAGELDFKGQYNGDLEVQRGATLSPGNSVGDLTVYGDVTIDAGATGLFEFSAYNENQFDTLTIANADDVFSVDANSIIKLYFEGADADLWAAEGAQYKLVSDEGFAAGTIDMSDLLGNYNTLFGLEGRTDGLYLIGLGAGPIPPGPEPGSGVPEPSTWMLLALGVVVLFLRKRVRS